MRDELKVSYMFTIRVRIKGESVINGQTEEGRVRAISLGFLLESME